MAERDRVETIVEAWQEGCRRGERRDPEEVVREHPEVAARLRARFDLLAAVDEFFDAPAAASVPSEIGSYRILERIGAGAMGTVYSAAPAVAPESRVALKVVHPHLLARPGFFKRFLREAQLGKSVRHENVVRTLDADAVRVGAETVHFLVMEHVEGQTLSGLLEELGTVPEAILREVARQMASGLAAIHAAGIVHRDLKPENALITADQRVRIMDLGIAREVAANSVLTQEGQFAGSLAYAAPEQFGRHEVGPAADLYSLGVTLYELATGTNPFRRDDFAGVMAAHREHVPPTIESVVPETSAFFSDLVQTLLAKAPSARFASAAEVAAVLAEGERSSWWRAREAKRPRAHRLPQVPVRRETALHGRAEDLALLARAWDAAKAGGGRTILLEGEAGIGKSRLVDAFLQRIDAADVHVLYGSYPPTGGLGGISDAILDHFGTHGLEEALRPLLTVTPSLVPAFAALVRHEAPPEGAAAMTPDAVHAVLVHLMRALAAEEPLVWIVEDLHFADAESRGYLLSLARAVEGHRVLLVETTRPGAPEDWLSHLARLSNFERRPLGRLSARDVMLLLVDAFKSERLAEKLGGRIALRSDGIPFFVFEMIRGLKDGQFITQTVDGTWVESRVIEKIDVPVAVKDLIAVRLSDLSHEQREILDVGSVLGFEFDPGIVAAVLEMRPIAVLRALAHVDQRSGVVRADGRDYRFDHHQLQECVYAALAPRLREETHAAVADVLERRAGAADKDPKALDGALCVDLAEHLLEAAQGPRALRYLDAALTHLEKGFRNEQAISLAERALAVPGLLAGAERARMLLRLCDSYGPLDRLGRRARQEDAAREVERIAESAGDDELRGKAAAALGNVYSYTPRLAEAEARYRRLQEIARSRGDKSAEATAENGMGVLHSLQSRHVEARTHFERSLEVSLEAGDRLGEARATGNLGSIFQSQGRFAEARDSQERALILDREIGNRVREAGETANLGNALLHLGRLEEAREQFQRSLTMSREIGARSGEAHAAAGLGAVAWSQVRYVEAREHFERAIAICRETGDRANEARVTGSLGNISTSQGRFVEARELQEWSLNFSREIRHRDGEAVALVNLGPIWLWLGDVPRARRSLEESLAICRGSLPGGLRALGSRSGCGRGGRQRGGCALRRGGDLASPPDRARGRRDRSAGGTRRHPSPGGRRRGRPGGARRSGVPRARAERRSAHSAGARCPRVPPRRRRRSGARRVGRRGRAGRHAVRPPPPLAGDRRPRAPRRRETPPRRGPREGARRVPRGDARERAREPRDRGGGEGGGPVKE